MAICCRVISPSFYFCSFSCVIYVPLGLTINWSKTKIQTMLDPAPAGNQVTINGHSVEVVESFPCLGSLIDCTGDSDPEIKRRVSITRECMMALDRNIWRSHISVGTKLRFYNSCSRPIFLYGAETWAVTATAAKTSLLLISGVYAAS